MSIPSEFCVRQLFEACGLAKAIITKDIAKTLNIKGV
jgi:hypothetical protein